MTLIELLYFVFVTLGRFLPRSGFIVVKDGFGQLLLSPVCWGCVLDSFSPAGFIA